MFITCSMSKHMGSILENAVRKSGYPIAKLARRVNYTRQHMYNFFQQAKVDLMLLEEIGKIINYNFADEIKELRKYSLPVPENQLSKDPGVRYETIEEKYIALLEEYNKLLKEYNELLQKGKK